MRFLLVLLRSGRRRQRRRGRYQAADGRRLQAGRAGAAGRVREEDRPQGFGRNRYRRCAAEARRRRRLFRRGRDAAARHGAAARQPPGREQRQAAGPRRHRCRREAGRAAARPLRASTASRRRCSTPVRSPHVDPAAGGSSGIYLARLFEKMGIAEQIKGKAVLVPGGLVAERLVDGKADLALQQSSELMSVPGVQFAGPIPARCPELHTLLRRHIGRLGQPRRRRSADAGAGRSGQCAAPEEEGPGRPALATETLASLHHRSMRSAGSTPTGLSASRMFHGKVVVLHAPDALPLGLRYR